MVTTADMRIGVSRERKNGSKSCRDGRLCSQSVPTTSRVRMHTPAVEPLMRTGVSHLLQPISAHCTHEPARRNNDTQGGELRARRQTHVYGKLYSHVNGKGRGKRLLTKGRLAAAALGLWCLSGLHHAVVRKLLGFGQIARWWGQTSHPNKPRKTEKNIPER